MPGSGSEGDTDTGTATQALSGAAITADGTIALACGSLLQVWEGEKLLLDTDVGEPISLNIGLANPVTLRADGKRVAYGLSAGTTVQVRGWSGDEGAFTLGPWAGGSKIYAFCWSRDGRFIAVVGPSGGCVYDGEGTQLHEFSDEGGVTLTCSFNQSCTLLASEQRLFT